MKNKCDVPIIIVLERKHIISFRWIYIDVHYCAVTRIVIRHFDWTMKYFARITTVKAVLAVAVLTVAVLAVVLMHVKYIYSYAV